MKIIHSAAIAALLSCSLMTPAYADPVGKSPTHDTSGTMTPQQICDAQLTPAEQSEFDSVAMPQGSPVVSYGPDYQGSSINEPSNHGTPQYSNVFLTSGFYRNGGSPNVWGGATATTTYPQTQQMFNMLRDQTTTTTFDCHVHKDVGKNDGNHVEPPGLQQHAGDRSQGRPR